MGANILNIGLTLLLLGQLLCCVRGALPPPGAHSGARCPPRGVHCFASFLLFASSRKCGVAGVGSDTYMRLKTARLRRAPEKEAQRHNTKEGPLWEARLVWAGQKRGRHLGTWEEKRGASKGSRVPCTDDIIGLFSSGVWLGQGKAKQGRARKESQRHNTIGSLFESWAGSE